MPFDTASAIKMEFNVLHVVATFMDHVMKNHMRKMEVLDAKAKTKLREFMRLISTGEVLANLDHEKDDALASPKKKRHIDDPTSIYNKFEDELEEIHDNGVGNLVVKNLDARIEFEFNM